MGIGVAVTVLATMITSITLLPALLGFARERVEVTRWRGLIAAGFVAVALLGIGIGVRGRSPPSAAGLAALTLLVSFAVRPLRRDGAATGCRSRCARPSPTGGAARSSAARGWWVVAGTVLSSSRWRRRSSASAWGPPTRATSPRTPYTRQAYDLLAEGFGAGFNGPFMITVVPGAGDSVAAVDTLQQALAETPGVAAVTPAFPNRPATPDAYLFNLVPTTAPQDAATTELVTTLRDDVIPAAIAGTGARRQGHRDGRRQHRLHRLPRPDARSSSSAPCWRCRSCS